MKRTALIVALVWVGCAAVQVRSGYFSQAAEPPVWVAMSHAVAVQRALTCPTLPLGCLPSSGSCDVHACYCPRVCAEQGKGWTRIWRATAAACTCTTEVNNATTG